MNRVKFYIEKLFSLLRVHPLVGGLEISDTTLRFVYADGKAWHLDGVRLPPGIMVEGKIKDRARFIAALQALKTRTFGSSYSKKAVSTIASLSSVNIYSQVFSLPIIEGTNLEKAIQLNIQMVSPIDTSQAYSGWQTVNEDQSALRLEVLSAFIDRATVDDIDKALAEAGFLVVAIEPRALSLCRVFKEVGNGFDPARSYILVSLDNSGIDFLIIRKGQLYFEYFNAWKDIADEKGNISKAAFETIMIRSLHQVMNFYSQHWPEAVDEVVLLSTALIPETEKIIKDNFPVNVVRLELQEVGRSIGPEWFVVLGCGLRGAKSLGQDREMSLLGIGAQDEFRRGQVINFLKFWRVLVPVGLSILLAAFIFADLWLMRIESDVARQSPFVLKPEQLQEITALRAEAQSFDHLVDLVSAAEKGGAPHGADLEKFYAIMSQDNITLSKLSFDSSNSAARLSALAPSTADVIKFKNDLTGASFLNIDLPISGIQNNPSGVSFSMTFSFPESKP
jgi:hypothetical protein